ncbi:MAG: sensor histidine kinase [Beutenbergiaceae bacterium]
MSEGDVGTPVVARDPWTAWAWLLASAWLVFLVFPIMTVWHSPALSAAERVVGLLLIAAFGATYTIGFARTKSTRVAIVVLVVLSVLALALAVLIGTEAVSLAPFVVAFTVFYLPWVPALVVGACYAVSGALAILLEYQPRLQALLFIIPLVYGFMILLRVMERWGERHWDLSQQLAVVNERDRLARDVHDVVGHSLTAVAVKSELAHRLVDSDPQRAKVELAQIQALVRESLVEVRATVAGLRVTSIDEELGVAKNMLTTAGIRPQMPHDIETIDPRHRIVMGWALREAITNVVRHSGANTCSVQVSPHTLTITDDGVGIGAPEGNGLRGLRERIRASGGEVTITAGDDGTGTLVHLSWTDMEPST